MVLLMFGLVLSMRKAVHLMVLLKSSLVAGVVGDVDVVVDVLLSCFALGVVFFLVLLIF